jgi:hypothetical protein
MELYNLSAVEVLRVAEYLEHVRVNISGGTLSATRARAGIEALQLGGLIKKRSAKVGRDARAFEALRTLSSDARFARRTGFSTTWTLWGTCSAAK